MKILIVAISLIISGCSAKYSQPRYEYHPPVNQYQQLSFIQLYRYMHSNAHNTVTPSMVRVMENYIKNAGMYRVCEHNRCFLIYGNNSIVIKREYIEITNGKQFLQTADVHHAVEYIYMR